jgi:hypothetical protein
MDGTDDADRVDYVDYTTSAARRLIDLHSSACADQCMPISVC